MPRMTGLREIVDYPYTVRSMILQDQKTMGLLADNPRYDPDSDDAEIYESRVKGHDYVDETSLTANAYIIIETELVSLDSPTMATMYLYVNVVLSKQFMDLNPKLFKGYKGNRRDNIAMRIHEMLEDNNEFGIGGLNLISATIGTVPTGYTSRILTYRVPTIV